ncbi:hypothetical protein TSMEX_011062 [Taenia solium]|eukprot:TsM_000719400 transcript=TsM_000719400 gene=TsM_000719400
MQKLMWDRTLSLYGHPQLRHDGIGTCKINAREKSANETLTFRGSSGKIWHVGLEECSLCPNFS